MKIVKSRNSPETLEREASAVRNVLGNEKLICLIAHVVVTYWSLTGHWSIFKPSHQNKHIMLGCEGGPGGLLSSVMVLDILNLPFASCPLHDRY